MEKQKPFITASSSLLARCHNPRKKVMVEKTRVRKKEEEKQEEREKRRARKKKEEKEEREG